MTTALRSGRASGSFTTKPQASSSRGSLPQWSRKASLCASRTGSCSSGPKPTSSSPSSSTRLGEAVRQGPVHLVVVADDPVAGVPEQGGLVRVLLFHVEPQPGAWNPAPRPRQNAAGSAPPSSPAARCRSRVPATPGSTQPYPIAFSPSGFLVIRPYARATPCASKPRIVFAAAGFFCDSRTCSRSARRSIPDGLFDGGGPGDQRRPAVQVRGPGGPPLQAGIQAGRGASGCPFMATG